MSFRCGVTGKVVSGERMNRVIVEKRDKTYTDEEGNVVGKGWEIVKEIPVSSEGMRRLNAKEEMERLAEAAE